MFVTIYCDLLARAFFSYHRLTLIRAKGMHLTQEAKISRRFHDHLLLFLFCFKGERGGDECLDIAWMKHILFLLITSSHTYWLVCLDAPSLQGGYEEEEEEREKVWGEADEMGVF